MENEFTPTILNIKGIGIVEGLSYDSRVPVNDYPKDTYAYSLRHSDNGDWTEIVSIKNGGILVNFYGMFFSPKPLPIPEGEELEVLDYGINAF